MRYQAALRPAQIPHWAILPHSTPHELGRLLLEVQDVAKRIRAALRVVDEEIEAAEIDRLIEAP